MDFVSKPKQTLSVVDGVSIIVGMVVGVGIFKTPSIVASSVNSKETLILLWLLGGVASFIGALCYAELASAHPHAGGDYHYLQKAFGNIPSFLYAWARITVIQTGSIAMVGFIIGDYASEMMSLGPYSASLYAAFSIILLTSVNIAGIKQGKWTQKMFVVLIMIGLFIVMVIGFFIGAPQEVGRTERIISKTAWGKAMIFVLLTYGGWNEASFLSAEVRSVRRNMVRVLIYSIGIVMLIYLLINMALLRILGVSGMAASGAVMADLMYNTFGLQGTRFISLLILLAALSTLNAAIITGARTSYALGRDYSLLNIFGRWEGKRNTPVNALLLQGCIALLLVILGAGTRDGFVTMVEYTAPVFWLFSLMVGTSIFILRYKKPVVSRPFSVHFYPITPFFFCSVCAFMLYSSLMYTGRGSLIGIGVLITGIPFMIINRMCIKDETKELK